MDGCLSSHHFTQKDILDGNLELGLGLDMKI